MPVSLPQVPRIAEVHKAASQNGHRCKTGAALLRVTIMKQSDNTRQVRGLAFREARPHLLLLTAILFTTFLARIILAPLLPTIPAAFLIGGGGVPLAIGGFGDAGLFPHASILSGMLIILGSDLTARLTLVKR